MTNPTETLRTEILLNENFVAAATLSRHNGFLTLKDDHKIDISNQAVNVTLLAAGKVEFAAKDQSPSTLEIESGKTATINDANGNAVMAIQSVSIQGATDRTRYIVWSAGKLACALN